MQIRITNLSGSMSTRSTSTFKDINIVKQLSLIHEKYVIVSAGKIVTKLPLCVNHIT